MFGDFAADGNRWKTEKLKETALSYGDGPFGSNLKSEHYVDSGVRVIRLGNIAQGHFVDNDKAFITEDHYKTLERYSCKPGAVIIATLGDPNLRACLVPDFGGPCIHKADCVYYEPDQKKVLPKYAVCYLNLASTLVLADRYMHGQTRTRVSSSQLAQLPIPLPDIALQREFVSFVEQVDKSVFELNEATQRLSNLYGQMLMQEVRYCNV